MYSHSSILSLLNNRYSCREFIETKKISESDFNIILEAGRLSPSAYGLEPWKFLVITSSEAKANLNKAEMKGAVRQLPNCSHFVIILSATAKLLKYNSDYIKDIGENIQFLTPDALNSKIERIKNFQENDFKLNSNQLIEQWASKQSYIPLTNMMLVATMLKIDSCPIEGFNIERLSNNLSEYFQVDTTSYIPTIAVAFGYRNGEVTPKKRRNLNSVVNFF